MSNARFRLVLDTSHVTSSPHLVDRLGTSDPFEGVTFCGKTTSLTSFDRAIDSHDEEVCEACMRDAHDRWRSAKP